MATVQSNMLGLWLHARSYVVAESSLLGLGPQPNLVCQIWDHGPRYGVLGFGLHADFMGQPDLVLWGTSFRLRVDIQEG